MKKNLLVLITVLLTVLTACNKDNFYTVTFETNGGTPAPSSQKIKEGDLVSAPTVNPTKTDYEFVYWHLSGVNSAYNFQAPVNNDFTLYAKWQDLSSAEYWQVSWVLNGGSWPSNDNHATKVLKGGTLSKPADPIKKDNIFKGWYKEPDLINKFAFPYDVSNVTSDIILYAKWTSESGNYTISLDTDTLILRTTDRVRIKPITDPSAKVTWSSSNTEVAIVNQEGLVKAAGAGTAVITASVGNNSADCDVSVSHSVFAGGYNSYANRPLLWKNGEELDLTVYRGPRAVDCIFIYEGNIYVAGEYYERYPGEDAFYQAVVVKIECKIPGEDYSYNKTLINMELKGKRSFAEDLFISDGDIYVVGYEVAINDFNQEYNRAVIWKNGKQEKILSDSDVSKNATARSVFVASGDIFVSGDGGYYVNDGVWKNGNFDLLEEPEGCNSLRANAVFVSGSDVYVAGKASREGSPIYASVPVLWKNNVPTIFDERGIFHTLFISENDVYVGGSSDISPVWKNGTPMYFDENVLIKSLYVYEDDVYAISSEGLWINGIKQSGDEYGGTVFVK